MPTLADLLPRVRAIVAGATPGPWIVTNEFDDQVCGPRATISRTYSDDGGEDARFMALHDPEIAAALWDVIAAADYWSVANEADGGTGRLLVTLDTLTTLLAAKLGEGGE